jgi:hypothetical protein
LNRKDSFITHRAFCDALAEESARITSIPTTNLNFKNEEGNGSMIGSHSQHGLSHGVFQNIGGIPHHGFHVDFNNNNSLIMDQQRPSLSLWLNHQGNTEMGQSSNNSLFGSSCLSEIVQMGNNTNNNNNALICSSSCSSSSSMLSSFGANSTSAANLSLSKTAAASGTPMSATALLQKAAQMGSTRSNHNNNAATATTTNNNNNNNNPSISSFGVMTSPSSNNSFDHFLMHGQQSEQGKLNIMDQGQNSNLTRDFLGVNGRSGPPPPQFLPQELAKFASIQYTGNHQ